MEGSVSARKVLKADREKLRRDRLNEQFAELGKVLDPERPRNDKGAVLTDTIQLLKDLNAQVDKLKAEYVTLSEESRELTQEKNDLREEKTSLKSDIESLNLQYQMRMRASYPWSGMDQSVVMAPFPYPMPMAIPVHPSMHSYPFFSNQNSGNTPNSFSPFMPHVAANTAMEQHSTLYAPPTMQPATISHVSHKHDSAHASSKDNRSRSREDSIDVGTELELKTPGSESDQGSVSVPRKSKKPTRKETDILEESSPTKYSTQSEHSSSNSVSGGTKPDTGATTPIETS